MTNIVMNNDGSTHISDKCIYKPNSCYIQKCLSVVARIDMISGEIPEGLVQELSFYFGIVLKDIDSQIFRVILVNALKRTEAYTNPIYEIELKLDEEYGNGFIKLLTHIDSIYKKDSSFKAKFKKHVLLSIDRDTPLLEAKQSIYSESGVISRKIILGKELSSYKDILFLS